MQKRLGLFPGEGIGPELTEVALQTLRLLEPTLPLVIGGPIGLAADHGDGTTLTSEAADLCKSVFAEGGAVLAGPGGGRFVYDCRRAFQLSYKLNPIKTLPGLDPRQEVDLMIVRENLGGYYQCSERALAEGVECSFFTPRQSIELTLRAAAGEAAARDGRLTLVRKEHGAPESSRLWEECSSDLAREYGLKLSILDIDFACYQLLRAPEEFSVLVTSNCFGDILSDLGGHLMGSRALTFGASFGANGEAIYQTNHGAAWPLAGKDQANPAGHLQSLAWLLDRTYGRAQSSQKLLDSINQLFREGVRTLDLVEPGAWNLGGSHSRVVGTREFGELVCDKLEKSKVIA